MPRTNPEVEMLRKQVEVLRRELDRIRTDPGEFPALGCGDNSCEVARPQGVGTNGGCRCSNHVVRHALRYWRRKSQFLTEELRGTREETAQMHHMIDVQEQAIQQVADYVGAVDYVSSIGPILTAIDDLRERLTALESQRVTTLNQD